MLRFLAIVVILVSQGSPVYAQPAPDFAASGLESLTQNSLVNLPASDSSCVIGHGGLAGGALPATAGLQLPTLVFSPENPYAAAPFADQDLPFLTLPDFRNGAYRLPRSLTWLPDSEALFGNSMPAGELAVDLPLLFPGLGQGGSFHDKAVAYSFTRTPDVFHDGHHENTFDAAARPDSALTSSLPSSVLPAGMHDALAGLHRLWACVGTDPSQLGFAAAGAGAPAASAALPAAPSWEVHEAVNYLGGLGRIYRASYADQPALVVNRLVSATQEELAFRVTQAEVNSAGVGCVKASSDDRIAATKQDNGNIVISMGPDFENKTFHVVLNGGLWGEVGGTVTTNDGPPGAACG